MAGMPAMEPDGDEPKGKGKGIDLAVIMGGGKEKPAPPSEDKGEELPPGFETAATEAFPDMEGDTERVKALWRAIKACDDY